ncbi:MAG: sugar ABC transporter permease [Candidatus Kapabacteria bacterium]|nr:sugar ABC transporter permease [Candidatus Kapabacteria bacterium]
MTVKQQQNKQTIILILPWILTFLVFYLYPLIHALVLSFSKYSTLTNEIKFIGVSNYKYAFTDKIFWKALSNTAFFTFGTVPLTTAISLALAAVLNSKFIQYKNFFRAVYFLPSATSLVVISLIFINLFSKTGYLNFLALIVGLPVSQHGWLLEPNTSMISIMAMDVWMAVGYYMVLFLSGMQSIPNDLYDSARLSGASPLQQLFRITLPLLKPTLLLVLLINTIKSFQVFIEIFVMTKGGPLNSTNTLVYMIYENAFEKADMMGYASALAFILFVILMIFSILQIKFLRTED